MANRDQIERGIAALQNMGIPSSVQPFGSTWCEIIVTRILDAALTPSQDVAGVVEPVGETGDMPGSNGGFSMAVFRADAVPVGTKLYVAGDIVPKSTYLSMLASRDGYARQSDARAAECDRLSAKLAAVEGERDEKIARALAKADFEAERAGDIENENDALLTRADRLERQHRQMVEALRVEAEKIGFLSVEDIERIAALTETEGKADV